MRKKKYSIAAHLLHSRLQLAASGLTFKPDSMGIMHVATVVWANKWLFHRASKSVLADHDIEVTFQDQNDAASLLLQSRSVSFDGLYVVQMREGDIWKNVKTIKGNAGCVPAGVNESFSFSTVCAMFCYITAAGNIDDFRIKKY